MAALIQFKGSAEGITLRLESLVSTIGRGVENDIAINDELVSKQHAMIEVCPARDNITIAEEAIGKKGERLFDYFLKDCDSTNGTFVNDQRVEYHQLYHDDVVRIGINHFRFVDDDNDDLAATTKIHKTWIPGLYISKRDK